MYQLLLQYCNYRLFSAAIVLKCLRFFHINCVFQESSTMLKILEKNIGHLNIRRINCALEVVLEVVGERSVVTQVRTFDQSYFLDVLQSNAEKIQTNVRLRLINKLLYNVNYCMVYLWFSAFQVNWLAWI